MLCSNKKQLEVNLAKLKEKFIKVHYPEAIIQEQFLRIEKVNRKDLILKPRPDKNAKGKKLFILQLLMKKIRHIINGSMNSDTFSIRTLTAKK